MFHRGLVLVSVLACGSSPPKPAPAVAASPQSACPEQLVGPWEHELFPGCAAWPYFEGPKLCTGAACKPCRIEMAMPDATEVQDVKYDASGRWISSRHQPGHEGRAEPDWQCTYAGDHLDSCGGPYDFSVKLVRDGGRLAKISYPARPDLDETIGYGATGMIESVTASNHTSHLTYDDHKRLTDLDDKTADGDHRHATYHYDGAGRVSQIHSLTDDTTYYYDDRGRISRIGVRSGEGSHDDDTDLGISYDTRDRPVMLKLTGKNGTVWTKQYMYCDDNR